MDRDSVLRKLKKMASKAQGLEELGSEAEANSFAELMQKLATEYQIDLADLKPDEQREIDPMDRVSPNYAKYGVDIRKRHIDWLERLAGTVARAHYCRLLVVKASSRVVFAGRRSQATAAAEVYLKLVNVAEALADKEYVKFFCEMKRAGDARRARGFRTSFLMGFCSRIALRYAEYVDALANYFAHDKQALVKLKTTFDEIDEWLQAEGVGTSKVTHKPASIENFKGYATGKDRADKVDLSGHKRIG